MKQNLEKQYLLFWLTQSISQLGSSMTAFALILRAYPASGSALTVSLMSFCHYIPFVLASIPAAGTVDRHSRKAVMLCSDAAAALASAWILMLSRSGSLGICHIYIANVIVGIAHAFQSPALSAAVGQMVPEEQLSRVSGMNAFSANLVSVLAPVLGAAVYAWGGISAVLTIDLCSFAAAFAVLLVVVKLPEQGRNKQKREPVWAGCREGIAFLNQNRDILTVVLTIALMNFFSRLTYENILSPMILARSGNSSFVLGAVNAAVGAGGIAGGLLVSAGKMPKDEAKAIYLSAAASFFLGDWAMAAGRNIWWWIPGAVAASLPIPFISAAQNVMLYRRVPDCMRGRVFAVRGAVQSVLIPAGILLGGFLADRVFEPFLSGDHPAAKLLSAVVGEGPGSGMAAMFLATGFCGGLFSLLAYRNSFRNRK